MVYSEIRSGRNYLVRCFITLFLLSLHEFEKFHSSVVYKMSDHYRVTLVTSIEQAYPCQCNAWCSSPPWRAGQAAGSPELGYPALALPERVREHRSLVS